MIEDASEHYRERAEQLCKEWKGDAVFLAVLGGTHGSAGVLVAGIEGVEEMARILRQTADSMDELDVMMGKIDQIRLRSQKRTDA